jgi:thymidylate kinase
LLLPWLEQQGWATVHVGLGRSEVARRALRNRRRTPESGIHTLALLYAADLADQGLRRVQPALAAGFVVVADRWTATARARCLLRGIDPAWLAHVLPQAPVPDLTVHLHASPAQRLVREIAKRGLPEFSECGRDMGLDTDPLRSFLRYQGLLDLHLGEMAEAAGGGWCTVDADADAAAVQASLRRAVRANLTRAGRGGVHV